jgi:hypothetical protein
MLVDSRTDLEMCLVAVSVKPFCLRLFPTETNRIIVIAPAWPKQAWFANLLRLSCARPLVLPLKRNLLSQFKGGVVHLSPERFHLVEGARPFTSNRKTRKSANCWTEILNGSISLPTHQSEKIVHFAIFLVGNISEIISLFPF